MESCWPLKCQAWLIAHARSLKNLIGQSFPFGIPGCRFRLALWKKGTLSLLVSDRTYLGSVWAGKGHWRRTPDRFDSKQATIPSLVRENEIKPWDQSFSEILAMSFCPKSKFYSGTRLSVGWSKDCQTDASLLSNSTRFPVSVKFKPTTDLPGVLVDQTTVPSTSLRIKSPPWVSWTVALAWTGILRLADQTTFGKRIVWLDELGNMSTANR